MTLSHRMFVALAALSLSATACDSAEKSSGAKAEAGKKAEEKPAKKDAKADAKADDAKEDAKAADEAPAEDAEPAADEDKPADEAAAADEEKPADEAPAAAAALPEPGDAGPAYFAIDDKGVFMLDGGAFTKVKKGPDKLVKQMSVGGDGKPYMLTYDGIMVLEGAAAKVVAKTSFKKTGSVDAFTVTPDGEIWTAGYKGVGHFANKKWAVEDKKVLGDDVTLLQGVAVDKDGRVWVASSNKLHYKDKDATEWKDADLSKVTERKPFFDGIAVDPSGGLVASASSAVIKIEGVDALSTVSLPSDTISSFGLLSYAANGIGAIKTSVKMLARIEPGGNTTTYEMGDDFQGTRVVALAPDGQGRLWVGTDIGIDVIGPADERASWMMGSVPEIAGKVKGILVVGAGPELPEVGEQKKASAFSGTILLDGQPLADAPIEICPEPSSLIKTSPCEDSPIKFAGTTDAEGKFSFADVPLGAYGVGVKDGDKWKITFSGEYGAKMAEGKPFDIGKLKFKK